MPSLLSSLNTGRPIDGALERILETAVARLQAGEHVDLQVFAAAHPEHAEAIRELLPAIEMLIGMGAAGADVTAQLESALPSIVPTTGDAPPPYRQLGDFRILRELGRGGMGTVFEAQQLSMGRRVALKVLPFAALAHGKALERFRNEVRAAAALDHPHIVAVYSVGEDRGVHYYAMQLIRGQTLAELIDQLRAASPPPAPSPPGQGLGTGAQRGNDAPTVDSAVSQPPSTVPVEEARLSTAHHSRHTTERFRTAARLGIQAAEALQHAHELGVLHRDIKPGNLMLDQDGELYITDFGLARIQSDAGMTMTGDIVGTLRYMAPEQALAKRVVVDHRADVYSLGATLYELLTFQPAFGETDRSQLLKQIAFDEPRPLRKIDRRIPAELEVIVLKAMEKNPDQRYQTSQQLADDLRALVEHRPIKAQSPTFMGRAAKWSRRHPAWPWAAALFVAVIAAAAVASALFITQAYRREAVQRVIAQEQRTIAQQEKLEAERQRDQSLHNLYLADMRQLPHDWEAGQIVRFRKTLDRYRTQAGTTDLRGWEWYYFDSLLHSDLMTLWGHAGHVFSVKWSPDGRRLATGGRDGTLRLWNAANGQQEREIQCGGGPVRVSWSPDGMHIATASLDGVARVFEVDGGGVILEFKFAEPGTVLPYVVDYSPDGRYLALLNRGVEVAIHDAVTGRQHAVSKQVGGDGLAFAWRPDSKQFALSADEDREQNLVGLFDTGTGQLESNLGAYLTDIFCLAWSADGSLVAAGGYNSKVALWDVATSQLRHEFKSNGALNTLAFSPDGKLLAGGTASQRIEVWDIESHQRVNCLRGHIGGVQEVAWNPDGSRLASASADGTIKIWNPRRSSECLVVSPPEARCAVLWSPRDDQIQCGWSDGTIKLIDAETGAILATTVGPKIELGDLYWPAWSSDGRFAAWRHQDSVIAWDVSKGFMEHLRIPLSESHAFSWSPDGDRLAIAKSETPDVHVWSMARKAEIARIETGERNSSNRPGVFGIVRSPDGRQIATSGWSGIVKIWDAKDWSLLHTLRGHSPDRWVGPMAWSPDGRRLASSGWDSHIIIWEPQTEKQLVTLHGHSAATRSVAWSRDGKRLASANLDGTVRLWDTQTGDEILVLCEHAATSYVAWSHDGTRIATVGDDGACRIWDARAGYQREAESAP